MLAQWRKCPGAFRSQFTEHVICRFDLSLIYIFLMTSIVPYPIRGINLGAAIHALDILLYQLQFGIRLRTATVTRQPMHTQCIHAPSLLILPEEKKHIPYAERIEQALQFATLVPLTKNLTSSAPVLSLMCRASDPSLTEEASESLSGNNQHGHSLHKPTESQLLNGRNPSRSFVRASGNRTSRRSLPFPQHQREIVWTLNSLRHTTPLFQG